ncbi:hypothetical protein V3C99_016965, partial [Haemonchus contortus]
QFQEPSGFIGHRFSDGPGDIGPAGFTEHRLPDGPGGFVGPATGPNNFRLPPHCQLDFSPLSAFLSGPDINSTDRSEIREAE